MIGIAYLMVVTGTNVLRTAKYPITNGSGPQRPSRRLCAHDPNPASTSIGNCTLMIIPSTHFFAGSNVENQNRPNFRI